MRVGFEAKRLFHNHTGLGNYSRNLISALTENIEDFWPVLYSPDAEKSVYHHNYVDKASIRTKSGMLKSAWRSFYQARHWEKDHLDLYHGLSHELSLDSASSPIPKVLTVHDLIHQKVPEDHSRINRMIYDFKLRSSIRRADLVLCISQATKQDVIRTYGIDEKRTRVVYQSVDSLYLKPADPSRRAEVTRKYNLPEDYLLFLGGVRPRKNLKLLLQAWQNLNAQHRVPVVLVGNAQQYQKSLDLLASSGDRESFLAVEPSSEELVYIYEQATSFVYPSIYEGFGIPILEAFAKRTPVITSDASSMPEVAGDAALLIDPTDPDQLSDAIARVLEDSQLRSEMIERGAQRLSVFSRENFALGTYQVYLDLLSEQNIHQI